MNTKLNYELIAKYLAGECTDQETEKIKILISEDPEKALIFRQMQQIWEARNKNIRLKPWAVEKVWGQLSREMDHTDSISARASVKKRENIGKFRQMQNSWIIRFAAIFLIAGLTALFAITYFDNLQSDEQPVMKEVLTERGQRAQLQLEDGSALQLNVDSKVKYPQVFDSDIRKVYLSGEAYFDIAQDERPFFVYADNAIIQILGTEFNVRAYTEDQEVQVIVADGIVNVGYSGNSEEEFSLLGKGDMASLQNNGLLSIAHGINVQDHLGWLERRLLFEETPMEEVSKKLERWYGVDIRFRDEGLAQLRLSATFIDEPLLEVLRVIQLALDIDYDIHDGEVVFFPNHVTESG